MGGKGDDLVAAFACAGCHAALDGYKVTEAERYEAMGRALAETIVLHLDAGLVQIKGQREKQYVRPSKVMPRRSAA